MICQPCAQAADVGGDHDGCSELMRHHRNQQQPPGSYQVVGRAGGWCDCQHYGTPQKLDLGQVRSSS